MGNSPRRYHSILPHGRLERGENLGVQHVIVLWRGMEVTVSTLAFATCRGDVLMAIAQTLCGLVYLKKKKYYIVSMCCLLSDYVLVPQASQVCGA